jgi:hypothetical protein
MLTIRSHRISEEVSVSRMLSSGIFRRVTLGRTDISEKRIASINSITTIGELGTTLAVTSNQKSSSILFTRSVLLLLATANIVPSMSILVTLMMGAIRSSETSFSTKAARRNILEDGINRTQP